MKKEIKYIVFYDFEKLKENRVSALATITKANYIMNKLCKYNKVKIISPSWTNNKKFYKRKKISMNNNIELIVFNTIPWISVFKLLSIIYSKIQLLLYLLFNTKKDDNIIVYHSMYLNRIISICKKIKKFQLILEVEEIYSDVLNNYKKRKKEINYLKIADSYLFSTSLLNDEINNLHKPFVLIHGTYQMEEKYPSIVFDKDNKKNIHCVYAGTFDSRKGGAIIAIKAAEFLPYNYHMHILGFGSNEQIYDIKKTIENISKKTKAKISYEGLLTGQEYNRFIQSCDIGLSTQNPNAAFNATSFPSKILSYMVNGLRVVSVRIPVVEMSDIGANVYYYNEQTPQNVADAILNVRMDDNNDSELIINKLDKKFQKDLEEILNE